MQFILPIIFGLISAAFVISGGNVVGGVIFGFVMTGMVWGAFFWRPGQASDRAASPSSTDLSPSQELNSDPTDMSSLSPRQVGNALAMSLDVSCGMQNMSSHVLEFIHTAGVSLERYHEATVLLAGFAQDYSISTLLRSDHRQVEVLAGYRQVWADLGSKNPQGAALYRKFLEWCPKYAHAVLRTEPGSISAIALAFGEYLGEDNAGAQILALSLADVIYLSHVEGTTLTLRKAKLLAAA